MSRWVLACALAALLPGTARAQAQEAAPQLQEDPRAARFAEVERGFFVAVEAGWLGVLKTPVADPVRHSYACLPGSSCDGGLGSGLALAIDLGYDVTTRFAVSAFWMQAFLGASASYGSFSLGMGGLGLRWAFVGVPDGNGVERFHVYVRGRGAWVITYPQGLFGTTDWMVGAGPGVEYFTRLRHFSVGLAVDGLYFLRVKVPAVDVVATLRYTF